MNGTHNVKASLRFILKATLTIGATLLAIKFVTGSMTALFPPASPSVRVAPAAKAARVEAAPSLDMVFPIPDGFRSQAKFVYSTTLPDDTGAFNPEFVRRSVSMHVPYGLTQQELDLNLLMVAREAVKHGADMVVVNAYDERTIYSSFWMEPMATLTFAPFGEWYVSDGVYDPNDYKAIVTHGASNFTEIMRGEQDLLHR